MKKFKSKKPLTALFSLFFWVLLSGLAGCSGPKNAFNPRRTWTRSELQAEYTLFRKILEDAHPSLYWYSSRDSMDYYFDQGYRKIRDSMTEPEFRAILSYVIARVNCGHTSVRPSKAYAAYLDSARLPQFPLGIKFWDDSAVLYSNMNRRDSVLTRGTIITSINGEPITRVRDSLFRFMVTDGFSINHKYQSLSNLGNFGGLYSMAYGDTGSFRIGYLDSGGSEKSKLVRLYDYRRDSSFRRFMASQARTPHKTRKSLRLQDTRSLQVDTAYHTAYMSVNSFTDGNHLRGFFRHSFKLLKEREVTQLVIDVRSNGGGNVGLSNALTQYLADHPFKLADSLYSTRRLSAYEKYISKSWEAFFFMHLLTHRKSDGYYHFGYFERHYFKPNKKNHFDGQVYILAGGNSFSATTLLINALKGQSNVKIVGEETGGGAYGNTAWFIPDVVLPVTGIRFRLPRFHMVMNHLYPKDGRGIRPDIEIKPSSEAIRRGYDIKLEYVKKLLYHSPVARP